MDTENKKLVGVIDDGTKEIPLVNTFGKLICKIHIRPGDLSILDRYNQLEADFSTIVDPLKDMDIKSDGTASFEEDWKIMKEVEAELKKRINALFDMDEADEIFAKRNPFSSVNGKFYCESVIEVIGNIITDTIEEEMKLSRERTDKYLADIEPNTPEVNGNVRAITTDAENS